MSKDEINFNLLKPQPLMVVISGPSGVGKDAVIKELQRRQFPIRFVVTTNSRKPRPHEKEGVDYYFISREKFEQMIANDEFIEYAHVYEDYKGVSRAEVKKAFESGQDVILRLDVQGAARIRKINQEAILIFLSPSNEAEWLGRIKKRGTETAESLKVQCGYSAQGAGVSTNFRLCCD